MFYSQFIYYFINLCIYINNDIASTEKFFWRPKKIFKKRKSGLTLSTDKLAIC